MTRGAVASLEGGSAGWESRAEIRYGYGRWPQLPTNSPGEHPTMCRLADQGGFEPRVQF